MQEWGNFSTFGKKARSSRLELYFMTEPLTTDQPFLRKLTDIVIANLPNENFGVNDLALESGYNHKVLNRNLRRLTGKSGSQFIREVRLQKALEMLQNETLTASEVAYKVGFTSPDYFNRRFHAFFGYPPGRIKKEKIKNHEADTLTQIISKSEHKNPYHHVFAIKKPVLQEHGPT